MVEGAVELIHRMRAERIAHLRAVEGDAHDAIGPLRAHVPVVGDVREVEPRHRLPLLGLERIGAVAVIAVGHASHSNDGRSLALLEP